ncbi:MAG: Ig-like domain-containing protein [Bacilli bacterium]|nr:Ig-like domain-containing protein [Bacilli bacterium]
MKSKIIPLLLAVSALTACSIIVPGTSSSEVSSSTSETTSTESTTEESGSTEASEESIASNPSSDIASSSIVQSEDISIEFNAKTGRDNTTVTDLEEFITITGATIESTSVGGVYQTNGTHIRVASSKKSGSISIVFDNTYYVKGVTLNAKSYGDSEASVTVAFGGETEKISVGTTLTDYSTTSLAGEGTTLKISSSAGQRFYLYGITLLLGEVKPVYPTSITVSPSSASIAVGGTKQISVTYAPANTNVKNLTFSSSDTGVATVNSSGLVKGVSVGEATITVSAQGESRTISATASFTIAEAEAPTTTKIEQTYVDYTDNFIHAIDSCPTTGEVHPLLIPVWFTDSSTYITSTTKKANVRSDIETAYFGSAEETGWHSVKSYYEEESKGQLEIDGVTSDWYECNKSSEDYYSDDDVSKTTALVESAVSWYFSQDDSMDRSYFDSDSDGYIDAVLLIYGAPDYSALNDGNADNLWAYCYWVQDTENKSTKNPGPNTFFWASYDFMYSSSDARSRAGSGYASGDTDNCTVDAHTFIHEMGHVFGLEDYYDYGSKGYSPAGAFSMQDYNLGGHDPYSVMAYGWSDPYIPTDSCEIVLKPFQESHDLILLTPEWNENNSPFDEYLLLELYTPTGLNEFDSTYQYMGRYPMGPNKAGIRLWHVDARLVGFNSSSASIKNITTDCYDSSYRHGVCHAFSNTYDDEKYGSILGTSYSNYNLLQLIRNDTKETYTPTDALSASDLFVDGDSFGMSTYSKQFVKGTTLNSGASLGWEFDVSISGSGEDATATINLIKN